MKIIKKKKEKRAFSLMEMIIATALFLIAITASIGIFLSTIKANNKINLMQEVENEIRYITETMSKEIRLGTVYYDYYEDTYGLDFQNPVSTLALLDNADNISYFALNGDEESSGIVQVDFSDSGVWSDLTSNDVIVDQLDFYLLPDFNPFAQDAEFIQQPLVIIYLEAHYNNSDDSEGKIKMQTSVTSRQYKK